MRVGLLLAAIVCVSLVGCGGQLLLDGSCSPPVGTVGVNLWFCSPNEGPGLWVLPPCQTGVAASGSCGPPPACFDCSGVGTGTEWTCGSGGWQAARVFACQ